MRSLPSRVVSTILVAATLGIPLTASIAPLTRAAGRQGPEPEPGSKTETALASTTADPVDDLSADLRAIREKHDLPGLAAIAIHGGAVVARGTDGVRRRGSETLLTIDDRFHLGSCTKSMTATLLATLVEEGKLSLGMTIGDVFGEPEALGGPMRPSWADVTIEQLLTHRSGAPRNPEAKLWAKLFLRKGTPTEQRMDLVRGTLAEEPEATPGTRFLYSNQGYAIAGAIAERVTKRSWEDLMRERIFTPLGMESAGFGAPGREGALDEPLGHSAAGAPVEIGPRDDNPPAIGPAGTVHASLGDWAKYIAAHLEGDRAASGHPMEKPPGLLRPESFSRLHEGVAGDGTTYAMGWLVLDRPWGGGRVLMHNGSNTMWYCVVWMAPEKDFAALIATNQGGDRAARACDEAATMLVGKVLPRFEETAT
jgi:CubicO group peptidase (beta-lactamase class C family)